VDWERGRFRVHSPKTEHHEGGAERWVPIFPELRPHLEAAFDQAPEGAVHVIDRFRDTNTNLRTQLLRIIRKAGVVPWPKLFHNLRATRETVLAEEFPLHVVCDWIGNSARVAAEHYLQVTEDHFQCAAESDAVGAKTALQNRVQQPAARTRKVPHDRGNALVSCDLLRSDAAGSRTLQNGGVPLVGLEPTTR
jgi:hypothetical protein